ncbi:MAG: TetR/AcrR family transcriptional regulator [Bryobacteraceae bacterium]
MSRPRVKPDAAVLEATFRVMGRVGPSRFTLAAVARECGLAPATLVQRFGSKRGLLLAMARQGSGGAADCFARVRAAHRSPLAAVVAAFEEMTCLVETPEAMANNLAWFQIDLTDPDFHAVALEQAKDTMAGFRRLLDEAVETGELVACDTRRLGRALHAAATGSMFAWAIFRQGKVRRWLRTDLETVLAPYRPKQPEHGRPEHAGPGATGAPATGDKTPPYASRRA